MQGSSRSTSRQLPEPLANEAQVGHTLRRSLQLALADEMRRAPLPQAALQLNRGPLLALIDADTLSEPQLNSLLTRLIIAEPTVRCILSANRRLSGLTPEVLEHPYLEKYQTEVEPNAADRLLVSRALSALRDHELSAALIFTQDRDLIEIALRWRHARRASFVITLRDDETAKGLINRCERVGISAISLSRVGLEHKE